MDITYIYNSTSTSGMGRRASAIARWLHRAEDVVLQEWMINGAAGDLRRNDEVQARVQPWPGAFGSKSVNWIRLGRHIPAKADVYDLTNQTLSFLARHRRPAVVTVHDIIEFLDPQQKAAALLNRYLYSGIDRAEQLIAVSQYTARTIREHFDVPPSIITVVYNGVDETIGPITGFRESVAYHHWRQRLKLPDEARLVLYVGSDHPRKNVPGALQVFSRARKEIPNLIFVKVGEPGLPAGRAATLAAIDQLGIRAAVRFVGHVSAGELNELYNVAAVLLLPSRLEGFGMPPLEAMAAGTPVVCSNAASLPEVVGDDGAYGTQAALVRDPDDIEGMASAIVRVLADTQLATLLRGKGLARARQFSWETAAAQVLDVYRRTAGTV
ncbi:MAG: hypothetical protein COT71_01695 [Candidatus Andersenbacteria bacterium CG10_big_fil_rev_8_21_14_0_10_54_11]|uniref:Glycosyltransferase family 1 protein n=1 Tax=Candidatus Andersenbacteria bacterium CG10_big_fil_rev_8_21_14_0_10_54_11 TaxID=1974485 RepID=A0A2M6WZQ6_9BACT|nr:MAG: hypothetical protein COT71_01695 [Candidatus Andersenbacteria bacterium CG10_big_fil_rev_8_21_14_0_10_54_11]